jgi:hypothetical protein
MPRHFTQHELEAFLDESLAPEEMARIEMALRSQPALARMLASISARRDNGVHTLGEIWRRGNVSCPPREQLGSYLLGVLGTELANYVRFHIETIGCRYCQANLHDLSRQQDEAADSSARRRKRYFQSSAGYLRGEAGPGKRNSS